MKVSAENLPRVIVLYKTSVAPVLQVCAFVIIETFLLLFRTQRALLHAATTRHSL